MTGDGVGGDGGCAGWAAEMIVVGLLGVPGGEFDHARFSGGYHGLECVGALMELPVLHVGVCDGQSYACDRA